MQQSMTRCKDCNTYMLTTLLEQSHNMCRYCIKRYNETTSKSNKYIPIKDCEPDVYTEWYKTTKLQPISDDEIELSQKPIPKSKDITAKGKNKFGKVFIEEAPVNPAEGQTPDPDNGEGEPEPQTEE